MTAAIIIIGDEILIGQVQDTNSKYIANALVEAGITLNSILTVGDDKDAIMNALKVTTGNYDHIFVTGGLGPTKDDITKKVFLEYFGGKLKLHQDLLLNLKERFESRGWIFHKSNIGQAEYPDSCEIIPNELGSAQGMIFKKGNSIFYSMPGVPHEMESLLTECVIPRIIRNSKKRIIKFRTLCTAGISESGISELIEPLRPDLGDISIAYLPGYGGTRIRFTATGTDEKEVSARLENSVHLISQNLPDYIYSTDGETMPEVVGKKLREKDLTVAVAESCTGGLIQDNLTDIPGSSLYFLGGVVSYSNEVKIDLLGVNKETIEIKGAVSSRTAIEMAEGIRKKMNSDIGLSVTGIAGPDGGTEDKPVGLVYVGYSDSAGSEYREFQFGDSRNINKHRSAAAALFFLLKKIKDK